MTPLAPRKLCQNFMLEELCLLLLFLLTLIAFIQKTYRRRFTGNNKVVLKVNT